MGSPRVSHRPQARRRILCVFPRYAPSFGTFQHAYALIPGVRAFMPPQGLLVIAAYLPKEWEVRFIDENVRLPSDADYRWADAVLMSGMHIQRPRIQRINEAAHGHGKLTVLGGPSVSASPESYPDVDVLHLGELGDATDALIEFLDRETARPAGQRVFATTERLGLEEFPIPAYGLIDMRRYMLASIQFSSGCPYRCEFCDIPALYGRRPRLKSAQQILAELDAIRAAGAQGAVYFVDDNFIGNPKATRELLPHIIQWQRDRGYPLSFACEATLNIAQWGDILEQMRTAKFHSIFCGIETPEPEGLQFMHKEQNLRQPLIDAVRKINGYGMELVAGIILGLDTDTRQTVDRVLAFIDESKIPMLTINLLYALPKTPLYDRLRAEHRLTTDTTRVSNIVFRMPYGEVVSMWRRCIAEAYDPPRLFERFAHQSEVTFPHRLSPPLKPTAEQLLRGLSILSRVMWSVGVCADYRGTFWRLAGPLLRAGRIEEIINMGVIARHLIRFTREALAGRGEACFYAEQPADVLAPTIQHGSP